MARSIPNTPNVNTRHAMMAPIPLNQKIEWIRARDLDSWGYDDMKKEKPIMLDCKIQYGHQRFYLRATNGHEKEESAYVLVRGKVAITTSDILRYQFPDGEVTDMKPLQISHIFDMSGNVFLTKVWVK